jgi:hypothetical protein
LFLAIRNPVASLQTEFVLHNLKKFGIVPGVILPNNGVPGRQIYDSFWQFRNCSAK